LRRIPTLSQSFDTGDFIPPDILSIVDAGVRAAAADIIERGGLAADIERIIDPRTVVPRIPDAGFGDRVPSMDPDEFMPYKRPEAPVISIFGEPDGEDGTRAATGAVMDIESRLTEIDIDIPEVILYREEAPLTAEDITSEIPQISRYDANLLKLRIDTWRFNKALSDRVNRLIWIAGLSAVVIFLIVYLFSHFH